MPGEPGETGMMESAVLGWVSQGLQHEVIAMASCCKKGYPLGHVPRSPRTAIGACAIRRMLSHLEAHSAI